MQFLGVLGLLCGRQHIEIRKKYAKAGIFDDFRGFWAILGISGSQKITIFPYFLLFRAT